jgi:hypothetical protein
MRDAASPKKTDHAIALHLIFRGPLLGQQPRAVVGSSNVLDQLAAVDARFPGLTFADFVRGARLAAALTLETEGSA